MRVLVTNDDGIHSNGIRSLKTQLEARHEVWTVAPHVERSGTSHAITLHGSVVFKMIGERLYSCDGTPADSVLYSLLGAIPFFPDVVVSGINHGPNIGTDIVYSGTVAAARQAALMGCPGIAVSLAKDSGDPVFDASAAFVAENLEILVQNWEENHLININIPEEGPNSCRIKITHPARRIYNDRLVAKKISAEKQEYCLEGEANDAILEPGSDWEAVLSGFISISPIYLHPLNHSVDDAYHGMQHAD